MDDPNDPVLKVNDWDGLFSISLEKFFEEEDRDLLSPLSHEWLDEQVISSHQRENTPRKSWILDSKHNPIDLQDKDENDDGPLPTTRPKQEQSEGAIGPSERASDRENDDEKEVAHNNIFTSNNIIGAQESTVQLLVISRSI